MDKSQSIDELVTKFVSSQDNESGLKQIGQWLSDARVEIENTGRISELKRVVQYHQKAADLSESDEERHVHMADIVVIQQRIYYLESAKGQDPDSS